MNKMIRGAILAAGVVAALILAYVGISGFFLTYSDRPAISRHLGIGLVGLLLLLLAHIWVAIYLFTLRSGLLRAAEAVGLRSDAERRHRLHRRRVLPWLIAAVILNAGLFLTGTEVLTGLILPWMHAVVWLAGLLCHVVALRRIATALADNDELLVSLDRAEQSPRLGDTPTLEQAG